MPMKSPFWKVTPIGIMKGWSGTDMKAIQGNIRCIVCTVLYWENIFSQWEIIPTGVDDYVFVKARHSGQCLNVFDSGQNNGDNAVQGEGCDAINFQWLFRPQFRRLTQYRHRRLNRRETLR